MNRILIIMVCLFFAKSSYAQSIDQNRVPAVILNVFQLKYPNAEDLTWKKDNKNYRIDFKVNNKSNRVKMDYKGHIFEHSQDLYISEIPKVVLETIRTRLDYFDVQDADKYERNGNITYEIKFKNDGKYNFFWLNEQGKLLKYRKELKDSELPTSIVNIIKNTYGNLEIDYSKYVEEGPKIIYIIRGEINDSDHDFTIDDKSNILRHYQDLKNSEIPAPIMKTLETSYKGYGIRDADLIEEGGKTVYVLKIKNSKEQIYVTFNPNGNVLKVK